MDVQNDDDKKKKDDASKSDEADFGDLDLGSDAPAAAEKPTSSEEDFGDLMGEPADKAEREVSPEERAWMDSIKDDLERNRSMAGIESKVQSAVVAALAQELRESPPEAVTERLRSIERKFRLLQEMRSADLLPSEHATEGADIEKIGRAAKERSANQTAVMKFESGGTKQFVIYKPRDGRMLKHMEADPFDQKEGRTRKEWLGSQMDLLLNIDRNPAATAVGKGEDKPGGAAIEFREGVSGQDTRWERDLSDGEVGRVADFHYLIWETDGHHGQYIVEDGGRLTTIDRGESFMEGEQPLRSEAVIAARERKLRANPEVLAAAKRYLEGQQLQAAGEGAFSVTFGNEEGKRRHDQLLGRLKKYVENGGIPEDVPVERTWSAEELSQERLKRLEGK